MKTIHFHSGLPRSGSTLLSALLNQNPDIYSSHMTDLLTSMHAYRNLINNYESVQAEVLPTSYYNVMAGMGSLFYQQIEKPIVFDKSRGWGDVKSMPYLFMLNKNPKILFPIRPPLEILASFINIIKDKPNNFIDRYMAFEEFPIYRDLNDARCDWLMSSKGTLGSTIEVLANVIKQENKEIVHFIHYDKLITEPQQTMNKIYNFLELPQYEHNFASIKEADSSNDEQAFGIRDLHKVSSTLTPSMTSVETTLSKYVIYKYKNALDFSGLF